MYISENLLYLRKKGRLTQEELADKLGVSRQSVSKWETGEAYPDTDKLISICNLFNVSLDAFMRNDLSEEQTDKKSGAETKADAKAYIAHMNRFSSGIAMGVFLILFGTAICVILSGYSYIKPHESDFLQVIGGAVVVAFVAAAVFLFVYHGMNNDRFRRENPELDLHFEKNDVERFNKKFTVAMPCLVSGILLDVVLLIILSMLIDHGMISANTEYSYCCAAAVFLIILAFIIGGLVYLGIQRSKYDVAEYNKQNRDELTPSRSRKIADAVCGCIMLTATAVFLVIGFLWNLWHPGWLVFPIGGIICGIVRAITGATDKSN